jgi:acyl-CoA thioester hydrolase
VRSERSSFSFPIRIYYEDTDFSGVVYHAAYLKFFERGRTEALRSCGVHHSELLERNDPLVFAVRKMTTEWRAPARIDDVLDVRTAFRAAKGARLLLDQEIWKEDILIARAEVEAVCMTLSGRPRRFPANIAAKLTGRD